MPYARFLREGSHSSLSIRANAYVALIRCGRREHREGRSILEEVVVVCGLSKTGSPSSVRCSIPRPARADHVKRPPRNVDGRRRRGVPSVSDGVARTSTASTSVH